MVNEVVSTVTPTSAEPPQPPSLRETIEQAVAAVPETPEPSASTPPREPSPARQEAASKQYRENGRFARPPGAEVPSPEEVQAASEVKVPETVTEEVAEPGQPQVDAAPKSWKAGVKSKWATLDPEVKAEIHRREREIAQGMQSSAPHKQFAQQFQETVAPYGQRYGRMGVTPLQLFKNFMDADTLLATAPMAQRAAFMAKMITDYGIDIGSLDEALSGGDPSKQPLAQVEQMIEQRLAPLQQFVQETQQQRAARLQHEQQQQSDHIEQMAADTEHFPHFKLVALDMADLMELNARRGIYLTPEEAYKRAVGMNPEAQQAEQSITGQQRAQSAHDAATRALGASLSVSGSPSGLKQGVRPDDLRGTIEAAWNAAQGR